MTKSNWLRWEGARPVASKYFNFWPDGEDLIWAKHCWSALDKSGLNIYQNDSATPDCHPDSRPSQPTTIGQSPGRDPVAPRVASLLRVCSSSDPGPCPDAALSKDSLRSYAYRRASSVLRLDASGL